MPAKKKVETARTCGNCPWLVGQSCYVNPPTTHGAFKYPTVNANWSGCRYWGAPPVVPVEAPDAS